MLEERAADRRLSGPDVSGEDDEAFLAPERLVEESGELRRFINIYVNQEDVRFLSGRETALKEGDEVSIVPAIAGGAA